jgi:hypothetical protein
VDQDHDGFGVEGAFGPCTGDDVQPGDCDDGNAQAFPGAPVDRCDHVDNDCDGQDEPPIAEICNGLDDDCKDGVDNGVLNACGLCGEVPTEICDNVDDDCDGVTDPNMREKLATGGEHVFTQAQMPGMPYLRGQVALVPRKDGGAWLFYRGVADLVREATTIQIVQLAKDGSLAGAPASNEVTDGTSAFVAATDAQQKWVAVVERQRRSTNGLVKDDSVWLRVQLFRAADMSLVSQYAMISKEDDDSVAGDRNDADDCNDVDPAHVAVQEDSAGDLYVSVVYRDSVGAHSASGCTATTTTYMRVAKRSKSNVWSLPQLPYKLADAPLSTFLAQVEAVPCRPEWLLAYSENTSSPFKWHARRSTIDGQVNGGEVDTFEGVAFVPAIAQQHVDCSGEEASTLVIYGKIKGAEYSTHVRRWSTDLATGTVSRVGTDLEIFQELLQHAVALETGGRWFLAGWTLAGRDTTTGRAILRELSFEDAVPQAARPVQLFGENGDGGVQGANPGQTPDAIGSLSGQCALTSSEVGIIAAFPNAGGVISTLDSYREEGATDPAVAVTYAIGCP